jgi:hypothetical protein
MFRPEQLIIMAGLLAYSLAGRLPIPLNRNSGRVFLQVTENTAAGTARDSNPVPYYLTFRQEVQNHNGNKYK